MLKENTKSLDKFFIIRNQPLFSNLKDREASFIANRSKIVEYAKDDIIYSKGEIKDYLYIIITGRVALYHPAPRKESAGPVIEILMKGDYFGLISLLTGQPHSLSAKVMNDARIIRIDAKALDEILKKIPSLAVHFAKTLQRRLKEKNLEKKKIFQRTILSVYYDGDEDYSSDYAASFGRAIVEESGKKAIVLALNKHLSKKAKEMGVKSIFMDDPRKVSVIISNLAAEHHFIIVDLPKRLSETEKKALKQSDIVHLLCDNEFSKMDESIERLKNAYNVNKEVIKVILREGVSFLRKEEELGAGSCVELYLPQDEKKYENAARFIARKLSGSAIGLALGAGGALGLAQIGILEVFEKEKIPVDIIAGTSIGSLISSLWVSGYSTREIKKIIGTFDTQKKTIGLLDFIMPRRGLIGGRNIRNFLTKYLGNTTFRDTRVPLRIVACDIKKREEEVLSSGKLVDAVMASIAIPGVFDPFLTKDGRLLVDGGVVSPVPINVLAREGIKRIIAVNSMPSPEDAVKGASQEYNIVDIIVNSFYSMEYRIGKYASQEADVYMHPVLKDAAWYEFYRIKEFVKLGTSEALLKLPEIKKLTM